VLLILMVFGNNSELNFDFSFGEMSKIELA
jgi:hypothetical protein